MILCPCKKATASLNGNNLVLSLPDAITPVTWVIDMTDSGTFVLKVEKTEDGMFILQKISTSGKSNNVEDIAYYKTKKKAIKAMQVISKAMGNTKSNSSISKIWSIIKNILFIGLLVSVLIIGYMFFSPMKAITQMVFGSDQTTIQEQIITPNITNDSNALGVPLSADDFLNNRPNNMLPF